MRHLPLLVFLCLPLLGAPSEQGEEHGQGHEQHENHGHYKGKGHHGDRPPCMSEVPMPVMLSLAGAGLTLLFVGLVVADYRSRRRKVKS